MKLLIKKGRVIDPKNEIDEHLDILIEKGKVLEVRKSIKENGARIIDAEGKIVSPALVDMHTHIREPGREDEETILTGSRSATKGGFGSITVMPNTQPPIDNQGVAEFIYSEARKVDLVNLYPVGAITKGLGGKELSEIGALAKSGVVAISDDGMPVMNSHIMRRVLEYSKMYGIVVISHCEDLELSAKGVMNEGYISTVLGFKGMPNESESIMVSRDIHLARLTGARLHIAHVSTRESINLIREAKEENLNITAETCPHYFTLSDEAVLNFDTNTKVKPPLRTKDDIQAIKEALKDGTIDAISTDHAPHTEAEKDVEYDLAPFGIIGLETALGISYMELVKTGFLSLIGLIRKMSYIPAMILNLHNKGHLSVGADADILIFNPAVNWEVKKDILESKSKNTPFLGWTLPAKPLDLIVGGRVIMKEGKITRNERNY
ncbi:MAG: dihydroorotase [Candidatus Omnitrophica bacterium]|nr:dihydroorotase [Candidatus Omnitrophota bacterium]